MNAAEQENQLIALTKVIEEEHKTHRPWTLEYSYPEAPNYWIIDISQCTGYSDLEIDYALKHAKVKNRGNGMRFRAVKKVQITYTRKFIKT